jgi:hypothetical protein
MTLHHRLLLGALLNDQLLDIVVGQLAELKEILRFAVICLHFLQFSGVLFQSACVLPPVFPQLRFFGS